MDDLIDSDQMQESSSSACMTLGRTTLGERRLHTCSNSARVPRRGRCAVESSPRGLLGIDHGISSKTPPPPPVALSPAAVSDSNHLDGSSSPSSHFSDFKHLLWFRLWVIGIRYPHHLSSHPPLFLQIHVTREEGTASVERPFLFSVPFQKFVSGAVLNIAEVISLLADNDTVPPPLQTTTDTIAFCFFGLGEFRLDSIAGQGFDKTRNNGLGNSKWRAYNGRVK